MSTIQYLHFLTTIITIYLLLMQDVLGLELNALSDRNDVTKEKRGVVDAVQGVHSHNVASSVAGHNIVPIPVAVPVAIPRPYPIGIHRPVALRVAVPRPYPVPVFLDPAASLDYGLGLYGYGQTAATTAAAIEYNALLSYLHTKSSHAAAAHTHNHLAHLGSAHDQHYAYTKLVH